MSSPDLRCLEVLPNGNVKLSWICPPDPNGSFFSYRIYTSNNQSGPYSLAGSIGAQATNTFVHNANALATSFYYYMSTRYGTAGADSSSHSDTLRSIFLNLFPAAVDLKLIYNNIRQPKLPSSSPTFTLQKEYPSNIWTILGITSSLNYQDTISVCGDSISYQVQLLDNSGCISSSNIQHGKYFDQKPPNQPYVDSISVLPNGQTVLAWRVPRDLDINKYYILKKDNFGINIYIDSVIGRPNTAYTYTVADALTRNVQLFVSALDSCHNISTFDDNPSTMFLNTEYDMCKYQTTLTWNAYKGMHQGVKEYRIYYSVNGSGFQFIGSTTQSQFVHTKAEAGKNLCYFVRVVNNDGNITASSNRTCFFSRQVKAANYLYIKKASVTDNSGIRVDLLLDTLVVSQGVELERSEDGISYQNIAFVPFNGTRQLSYLDQDVKVQRMAYYYRAILSDSCGNVRIKSNTTRTCFLTVKQDKDMIFTQHLSWEPYLGYGGGISGYYIYRRMKESDVLKIVGFADAFTSTFTDELEDEARDGSQIEYNLEVVEGLSNPFGIRERSLSNAVPVYIEGRVYVPNAFAPEGVNKTWLPVTHFVDKSDYLVRVYNRWGSKVFESNRDDEAWDGSNCSSGVYVYLISYKNSRGEYMEAKGNVMLLR